MRPVVVEHAVALNDHYLIYVLPHDLVRVLLTAVSRPHPPAGVAATGATLSSHLYYQAFLPFRQVPCETSC